MQELLSKKDELNTDKEHTHFIGHLQTNKINMLLPHVSMIESVGSIHLAEEISKKCKENGIETEDIVVHINGDQITAVISTAGNITQEQERGIRDGLARDFGIEEKNCQLLMGKDEQTTLAGDSASGPFTDGNRISHIENRD